MKTFQNCILNFQMKAFKYSITPDIEDKIRKKFQQNIKL